MAVKLTIQEVNKFSQEDFIRRFGNIVEMTPLCAAAISDKRPFSSVDDLYRQMCSFIDGLSQDGRRGILRCHPDLEGKMAQMKDLTPESKAEQSQAGLDKLSSDESILLSSSNSKYRAKFDFPFVICARKNKKEGILEGIQRRLLNDGDTELINGIAEVKKIMLLRLNDLLESGESKL
ncbi:predicted protein [Nematostella vectensis]|uniref:2-oxo-4-hydroxy-4-carboxy-5-ureidoimidazoline decarboxylase n=1 Tax=Nematostella vectensis TaxID=45351 RepID=A7RYJ8_NEMVE|nr:predicted protein [Nematostella vectensis]|eukprot:XP_001635536.1 predicted protein [Nematostella vectensis]